jgi:membrane protein
VPLTRAPWPRRLWNTIKDYARRVWLNAGEDDIFFLTSAVAFNILLAIVPFALLLLAGLGYWLNHSAMQSRADVWDFVHQLLPPHEETVNSPYHVVLNDIIKARRSLGVISSIAFVWLSTRLFGSLRSALASVFDVREQRGIISGKMYDIAITVVSTALLVAYTAVGAYLKLATSRGVGALAAIGLRHEMIGRVDYYLTASIGTAAIALMFFALYKYLPNRPVRWQPAAVGALVTTVLLQGAKLVFDHFMRSFNPGSLYAGALSAVVIIVIWVYYAALIFLIGGEVGQVYDIRRAMRMQRETFED